MKQAMFFPAFTDEIQRNLSIWRQVMRNNPTYLADPECPYTDAQILLLEDVFKNTQPSSENSLQQELDNASSEINIESEAKAIYREMKAFKNALDITDVTEKASMFRVTTSLLEKLLDMAERAKGIKKFEEFETLILNTMDRYLDPQQKAEFVDEVSKLLRG
jgi:hypothetical protein